MIIRPATLSDLNRILDIAMETAVMYPNMRPDQRKMRALGVDAISAARHYALVTEREDGFIDGVLIAFVTDNAWSQRQNAQVMLWVSRFPGSGAAMLRKFRDWVKSRRAIKVAGFAPDVELDPRVLELAERIGFKRHGGAYLLYN